MSRNVNVLRGFDPFALDHDRGQADLLVDPAPGADPSGLRYWGIQAHASGTGEGTVLVNSATVTYPVADNGIRLRKEVTRAHVDIVPPAEVRRDDGGASLAALAVSLVERVEAAAQTLGEGTMRIADIKVIGATDASASS